MHSGSLGTTSTDRSRGFAALTPKINSHNEAQRSSMYGGCPLSFWSGETLEQRLPKIVEPFESSSIDCAAYTLHVGDQVYVSPDYSLSGAKERSKRQLKPGEAFAIPPGQFAFLLSDETVIVPDDALAFISIKARQKLAGMINISGFHVDPGYEGKLLFSVLNAGPRSLSE